MQRHRLLIFLGSLAAVICGLPAARALSTTSVSITATNVTMPSSGNGVSNYTINGIPASGTVTVGCLYSGAISTARIPSCTYGPIVSTAVTAGEIVNGTIQFYPFGAAVPVGLRKAPRPSGHLPAAGLGLAGILMVGLGARQEKPLVYVGRLRGVRPGRSGGNQRLRRPQYRDDVRNLPVHHHGGLPGHRRTDFKRHPVSTTIEVTVQ